MSSPEEHPYYLTLTAETYQAFDDVALEEFDVTFEDLAHQQPYDAYRMLREFTLAQFGIPPEGGCHVQNEQGLSITSEEDGMPAALGALVAMLEKHMPTVLVEPIDVMVIIAGDVKKEPRLHFIVEPPSLAF